MRTTAVLAIGLTVTAAALAVNPQTFTFRRVGNCDIQADVYRPADDSVRPVILWIHGGALIMGHRGNLNYEQLERYLRAGFVVVSIDYRLAPETKLPAILEDIRDAHKWVREKGPGLFKGDPDRIGVVGHSAGGYLTLMSGFILNPRPKALVSFYGYGDIAGEWYSRPDPFYMKQPAVSSKEAYDAVGGTAVASAAFSNNRSRFYLYCRQHGLWPKEVAGRDPDSEPKAFDPFCPIRNVTKQYPPTLLLHGDRDTDVPYDLSRSMAAELKRKGVESELITIPGGGHGFDRAMSDPQISSVFDRAVTFLSAHLK